MSNIKKANFLSTYFSVHLPLTTQLVENLLCCYSLISIHRESGPLYLVLA